MMTLCMYWWMGGELAARFEKGIRSVKVLMHGFLKYIFNKCFMFSFG